jgi:hypothetical protein
MMWVNPGNVIQIGTIAEEFDVNWAMKATANGTPAGTDGDAWAPFLLVMKILRYQMAAVLAASIIGGGPGALFVNVVSARPDTALSASQQLQDPQE